MVFTLSINSDLSFTKYQSAYLMIAKSRCLDYIKINHLH